MGTAALRSTGDRATLKGLLHWHARKCEGIPTGEAALSITWGRPLIAGAPFGSCFDFVFLRVCRPYLQAVEDKNTGFHASCTIEAVILRKEFESLSALVDRLPNVQLRASSIQSRRLRYGRGILDPGLGPNDG
ncbi:hypothetical protein FRX31_022688 [Thalictrum thalictroides]|uniref:Uncharacterized protein n=1 Tax=Thalictrum thalictroides TaxID=46969 RepID=A0A7J6VU29_THATH|nr:hypothetical protein FRX31_022688 [Thalictrum thalictroides]